MWTVCKCLGIDLASRKRWQCGQCTLVRVAWAEPGLPVSGRDMWEDWLEDWREDLRFLDEVRVDEWRVEELRVDEWRGEGVKCEGRHGRWQGQAIRLPPRSDTL